MKFEVCDNVKLEKQSIWEDWGFDNSIITKAWISKSTGKPTYSIKSYKGHTIDMVGEKHLTIIKNNP